MISSFAPPRQIARLFYYDKIESYKYDLKT
jgi:hypothetical protein